MNYEQLKELDRTEAIKMVLPDGFVLNDFHLKMFPQKSEVIVFGGNYWRTDASVIDFIEKYVEPNNEVDIQDFFSEMGYTIVSDPILSNNDLLKQVNVDYKLIYEQHRSLFKHPDRCNDWAQSKGTYIWFSLILPKRRQEQFVKIKKELEIDKLRKISAKIKKTYNFSDRDIMYLQYFCSQTKLDNLDPSLNTFLYLWSKEQFTGKTTVASYICSFLNGETNGDATQHKSKLKKEMQMKNFDIPKATSSRCTLIDEGGFFDMQKVYDDFKQLITSNSCEVEFKYKTGDRTRRCFRNYIMTSNVDPIYFVQDETERRILAIHFTVPEDLGFPEIQAMWHEFVLECNLSALKLSEIYREVIRPNSQVGEINNIMLELRDIFSRQRIDACTSHSSFNVANVMTFNEIAKNDKKMSREVVKRVLIKLYGQPDNRQRFYKLNRIVFDDSDLPEVKEELPFW